MKKTLEEFKDRFWKDIRKMLKKDQWATHKAVFETAWRSHVAGLKADLLPELNGLERRDVVRRYWYLVYDEYLEILRDRKSTASKTEARGEVTAGSFTHLAMNWMNPENLKEEAVA